MQSYDFLLWLAIILLFTKLFGVATARVHLPQVVGALLAGVLLGPSCFGIVQGNDFIFKTAEIGVLMLMFIAGLDTDMTELKRSGGPALVIACLGVALPVLTCGGVYYLFFGGALTKTTLLKAAFVGVVFAATSVSITVETLTEMGKIKSRLGTTLISAALIDDIIGIVVLSFISGFGDESVNTGTVLLKIVLFFVFVVVVGIGVYWLFRLITVNHEKSRRIAVWGLAFCFVMAYCSERLFGVADITGAYFAGVILCNLSQSRQFLARKMTVASYVLFSPVFFAAIGLRTNLRLLGTDILVFAGVLLVVAVVSKIIGCGLGARLCGLSRRDSLGVGVGMVARGEVALMVAQKGINAGYIDEAVFPAVVLVVVVAALITPVLLKLTVGNAPDASMVG